MKLEADALGPLQSDQSTALALTPFVESGRCRVESGRCGDAIRCHGKAGGVPLFGGVLGAAAEAAASTIGRALVGTAGGVACRKAAATTSGTAAGGGATGGAAFGTCGAAGGSCGWARGALHDWAWGAPRDWARRASCLAAACAPRVCGGAPPMPQARSAEPRAMPLESTRTRCRTKRLTPAVGSGTVVSQAHFGAVVPSYFSTS